MGHDVVMRWYVAKYMGDLRRREPVNVGVIVCADGMSPIARFLGEQHGQLDGRVSRSAVGSTDAYRGWVEYWRDLVETRGEDGIAAAIERARSPQASPASYYLEGSGEAWSDDAAVEAPGEAIDKLFSALVRVQKKEPRPASLPQRCEELFRHLGIAGTIDRQIALTAHGGAILNFDYRFVNGSENLFRRVGLTAPEVQSWDNVYATAHVCARATKEAAGRTAVALISPPNDRRVPLQIAELERVGTIVVDVRNTKAAAVLLRDRLHLPT